jgi:hypothetical protein
VIPGVVAIETGGAQTGVVQAIPGLKDRDILIDEKWNDLERSAIDGESPVHVIR